MGLLERVHLKSKYGMKKSTACGSREMWYGQIYMPVFYTHMHIYVKDTICKKCPMN